MVTSRKNEIFIHVGSFIYAKSILSLHKSTKSTEAFANGIILVMDFITG